MNNKKAKKEWLEWFTIYGPKKFLNSFLRNVEGAEGKCIYCGYPIYVDVLIGGGVPAWSTENEDFGCDKSPDTCSEGVGSHRPIKKGD